MGWGQLKNGALLQAADPQFEALLTSDQNLKHQQAGSGRKLAILVLPTNNWSTLRGMADKIVAKVATVGRMILLSFFEEEGFDMALEQVDRHVTPHGGCAFLQQIKVTPVQFGGYLEPDMQQLPQIRVELRIGLVVP